MLALKVDIYILASAILIIAIIAFIALSILTDINRKRIVSKYFDGHVSTEMLKKLQNGHETFGLLGEERVITVFFNDIRSFSELSEKMTNKQVMEFISYYYSTVSKILLKNNATIDKFLGDGVMAFWGAPLYSKFQAYEAAISALELLKEVKVNENLRGIDIGVGINTGQMIVGNLGKSGYTVLGDNVNLGSRLESLNKHYGTRILVTEEFIAKLEQEVLSKSILKEVFYREIDIVKVVGKTKKVKLFEIIDLESNLTLEIREGYDNFEKGIRFYRRQKWDMAIDKFRLSDRLLGGDRVSKTFIHRCKENKLTPYYTSWDGHFVFNVK